MKGSHSRLLQVVVSAMLINVAPDGRANTYDLSPVRATIPDDYYWEGADFETVYNEWDTGENPERSGSGGDGTNDTEVVEEVDEDKKAECDAIAAKVSSACDLENPPLMVTNGCGSGVTTNLVPDYLTVNGVPVYRIGPVFEGACNEHDVCYGIYPGDKAACDQALYADMIDFARSKMTSIQWGFYGTFVKVQAASYSAGLQVPPVSYFAENAFRAAQLEGVCRTYAAKATEAGCFDG